MKHIVCTLLFLSIFYKSDAQKLAVSTDSIRRADSIPELGYAVITADAIKDLNVLGFHKSTLKNDDTKALPDDYFHLGSNTKAITAFIAGYLVERKKINWGTKFFTLFPDWQAAANPAYVNITLADLLSHRARIKPFTSGAEFQSAPKSTGTKSEQRKIFAKYLLTNEPLPLNKEPYNYSNAGYSIAALMLEEASGKTWEDLVEEVLGKGLKLRYKFGWPNRTDDNQPSGHWMEENVLTPLPSTTSYNLNLIEPAGDISMPLADYAKLIQMNLAGLKGQNNFLKAGTYNYMHYGLEKYAMGWLNVNTPEKHISEHAGSAGTFYCYTLINKDKNIAYIVTANSATENALKGVFKVLEVMIKSSE
ncbi:MAG: class A beta-lactamase-related serine hydrolase [Pedobacter sp.]|nr:MAG: class A beta-lactamase-related serine hydrolase [Pedobacter sp.]